jgi:hypothetical protein
VVPEVLVAGGGGSIEGLAATLMRSLGGGPNGDRKDGGSAKKALDTVVGKVEKETGKHRSVTDMAPEPPVAPSPPAVGEDVPPPPVSG